MSMRTLLASVLVIATLLFGQPSIADDGPDASDSPRTSGPLLGAPIPCEDNGPAGPNQAKGQSCSWSYDLVPAESNPTEDFMAYWVQIEIDPGKGWCAKEISFQLDAPSDGRIVSAVPDKGARITRSRPATTELVVDAEGGAPIPGQVAQDVLLRKGRTTVTMNEDGYKFVWRGNSPNKVMIAVGVQLARVTAPPELFSFWSEGQGFGVGSCRPIIIRTRSS